MISLPWDRSSHGSAVSSNEVEWDHDDQSQPNKKKKRPSEESDVGSDDLPRPIFSDPPPRVSETTDQESIAYSRLDGRAPAEPYNADPSVQFVIYEMIQRTEVTNFIDPAWETTRVTSGGTEWGFMEEERPPHWKGVMRYDGHSNDLKMTSFISAWMDRRAELKEPIINESFQVDPLAIPAVHPHTNFDEGRTIDSDIEADLDDIKRAQKLLVNMTPIVSTPAFRRCVRTVYRGDFAQMEQEAQNGRRRVRKYMVADDLSDEATHALEWTVGTVLRDGDTLLVIFCADQELGATPKNMGADDPRTEGEKERHRAVQDMTDRVVKLLRKTNLQVKVVVEVIYCESPKHLMTEVIDFISPTLVILGGRGRRALRGVILGSFSNYLVTKSSVPVMVVRNRLRKHSKKNKEAVMRPLFGGLSHAKVD